MLYRHVLTSILVLTLGVSPAWASRKTCPAGQLASSQTATGASTHYVNAGTAVSIAFQYVREGGTAVVQTEICCTDDCDMSTGDWAAVSSSSKTIDGTTLSDGIGVDNPACLYRTNVTTCTGCTVSTYYRCGIETR